ncbi:MAG: hypothetical protein WAW20_15370, partial [Anaerolineae bacterium]
MNAGAYSSGDSSQHTLSWPAPTVLHAHKHRSHTSQAAGAEFCLRICCPDGAAGSRYPSPHANAR